MAKTIIKEVAITILICIAVGLVIAIIFYKDIPTNKATPSKVTAYETPKDVAEEIAEETAEQEFETTNQVFEVTDWDLELYKSAQSYNPGKSDPFAEYAETTGNATSINGQTGASSGSSSTGVPVDQNTTNNYYTASNINPGSK